MSPYRLADTFLESLLQEDSPCGDAASSGQATKIAAAVGIDAGNAAAYAAAGAHILVTSAPYFARPRDVAVTLESG